MQKASDMIESFTRQLVKVQGECPTHGADEVLAHPRAGWRCRKCLDAQVVIEERAKRDQQRIANLVEQSKLPVKYAGQRFQAHTGEQKAVRAIAAAFRDRIVAGPGWASLIFAGGVGTGKTLMASEFGESVIRKLGRTVRYTTAQGMISEIQAQYGREGRSEKTEIDRFVLCDLLIIDEIDAKRDSDAANLLLTEIINRRYNAERPVVVITNQPREALADFVGDRIDSRLRENSFVCAFTWPDFRRSQ